MSPQSYMASVGQRLANRGQPGTVAEQHAHGGLALLAAANSGQCSATGRLEIELPALGEHQQAERRHRLAHGEHVDERVARPGPGLRSSAHPAQRSTTGVPSSVTASAAPSSPCSRKFVAKALRNPAKRGSQEPLIVGNSAVEEAVGRAPTFASAQGTGATASPAASTAESPANTRTTLSATQTGFSPPSVSTVKRVTTWCQPPPTSETSTICW